MMMTSGGTVHYKNMFDAGSQIIAKEGAKSLFKGAAANILRGVAGAGVLSLYDKIQQVLFGKVYSGGMLIAIVYRVDILITVPQALVNSIDFCGCVHTCGPISNRLSPTTPYSLLFASLLSLLSRPDPGQSHVYVVHSKILIDFLHHTHVRSVLTSVQAKRPSNN